MQVVVFIVLRKMTLQAVLEDWLGRAAPDTWDQWQLKLSLEHMCEVDPKLLIQVRLCQWKLQRVACQHDAVLVLVPHSKYPDPQCSSHCSKSTIVAWVCKWQPQSN